MTKTMAIALVPMLTGCIWISKDDYITAMGCDPEDGVTASKLWIQGELGATKLEDGAGVVLAGEGAMGLGRAVAVAGDLDGDGKATWMAGGQGAVVLGDGVPPTGGYGVNDGDSDDWATLSTSCLAADTCYLSAVDGGDLSGDGARDLLVMVTEADPVDASGLAVYLVASDETNWSEPSLPEEVLLLGEADDTEHGFDALSAVVFSELSDSPGGAEDGPTGLLLAGSHQVDGDGSAVCLGDDVGAVYFFQAAQLEDAWSKRSPLVSGEWAMATAGAHYEDAQNETTLLGCATVAGVGDVDGDGRTDALLGAPGYSERGRAFLVPGSELMIGQLSLTDLDVVWADQDSEASLVGFAVADAGDVDGDGYGDALIGTHQAEGEARLYHGGSGGAVDLWVTFTSEGDTGVTDLGREVAGAGDIDSDNMCTPDLVIGGLKDGALARWVFLGDDLASATANTSDRQAILDLASDAPAEGAHTLAPLTDLSNDGYAELLTGAPEADSGAGALWTVLGGGTSR